MNEEPIIKRKLGRSRKYLIPEVIKIKKKRGRPPKVALVPQTRKDEVKQNKEVVFDFIDYIGTHLDEVNRAYVLKEARRKGWSRKYTIGKLLFGCFGIKDTSIDLESIKNQPEGELS